MEKLHNLHNQTMFFSDKMKKNNLLESKTREKEGNLESWE